MSKFAQWARRGFGPCGDVLATTTMEQSNGAARRMSLRCQGPATWRPLAYQSMEYGLQWYRSKDALLASNPGPVLVGASYEYEASGSDAMRSVAQARKYAAFQNHWDYWDCISLHNDQGVRHNLHEVFPIEQPRCLYFDLDGAQSYRADHQNIISWLQIFVRWVLGGDRHNWGPGSPEPVVLTSGDPSKYSCHVVFPQIQFRGFQEQREYIAVILNALPALEVDLEGGESVPILARVVDRVPYSQFQLFRGPYACKLSRGELRADTCLEPEGHFRSDPLAYFASHTNPAYALPLPPISELLAENEEVRHYHTRHAERVAAVMPGGETYSVSPQDLANLYDPQFQQGGGGIIDFAGLTDLEKYETALPWTHPGRASQWWSWFRISGVTRTLLEQYSGDAAARKRIWEAHFAWSRHYAHFDADENVHVVEKSSGRRVSGLGLLMRLVQFDNPSMELRTSTWRHQVPPGAKFKAPAERAAAG